MKLCECGCGKPVEIAKSTDKRTGAIKGQSLRFIFGHNWKNKKRTKFTESHKQKISDSKKGKKLSIEHIKKISGKNNHLYGKKRPKEHCEKISKGRLGIIFTETHIKNMSIAQKGKIISDITKQKISKALKGRKLPVRQIAKKITALKEKHGLWKGGNKKSKQRTYKKASKNPMFKLNSNISRSLWGVLKGEKKNQHWELLVGYTLDDLKKHLEKLFTVGMTWNNYGEWHIDHSIPISAFNFTKPEHIDFKRCWALNNLQPMWALENISKGAKLNKHFQPSLLI